MVYESSWCLRVAHSHAGRGRVDRACRLGRFLRNSRPGSSWWPAFLMDAVIYVPIYFSVRPACSGRRLLHYPGLPLLTSKISAIAVVATALVALSGCAAPPTTSVVAFSNPTFVPATNRDVFWDNVVDVTDDYFKVVREDRVRQVGDLLTEGQIETRPEIGSTLLEPWNGDSVSYYQRVESTLQSIRRQCVIRVIPDQGGFLVDVQVYKELEDVFRPQHATASAATFRTSPSVVRYTEPIGSEPRNVGWIPVGRDTLLEQRIIARIYERFGMPPPSYQPGPVPGPVVY